MVLLVHGLGEFLEIWSFNIIALSEHFTVYAIDLPGHGLSEEPKQPYTASYSIKFIADFMKAMKIQYASLVGRSLGASICLNFALDFPDKVSKLVLVSCGGFNSKIPLTMRLAMLPLIDEVLSGPRVLINNTTVRFMMKRQFYKPQNIPEEWINTLVEYLRMPKRRATIRNIIRSAVATPINQSRMAFINKLSLLKTPTLFIHGVQDRVVPIDHARNNSSLIPRARLEAFEECGHNPQIDKAPEFNRVVVEFLGPNGIG